MKKTNRMVMALAAIAMLGFSSPVNAQKMSSSSTELSEYLVPVPGDSFATPDAEGFIRRWTLLEPISKPNGGNTVFVDSYVRAELTKVYYKNQYSTVKLPKDGQKEKVESETPRPTGRGFGQQPQQDLPATTKQTLVWHSFDSKLFNVKLFRLATNLSPLHYGVIFHAVTVINSPVEQTVRLSAGSNSASMWWLNGEEVLIMSGDRRMVADDCASERITLKEGKNILWCAVINGPGMSDMCARFIDEVGNPVKNITITTK
ncbi:MAG: acetylxylan esterase [Bacteroidaceae bacterium]|nr:acetylxylan esterase [Bacteroidaceae bacterium]